MANVVKFTSFHTRAATSYNSGGNVMLDVITLNSGQILVISDVCVCRYDSWKEFKETEGNYDWDKECIDLLEDNIPPGIRETCYFCKSKWGYCRCQLNIKPFLWNGTMIHNPLVDSSDRFFVNPYEFYGDAFTKALED